MKLLSYAVMHQLLHHPDTGQHGPTLQSWTDTARKAVKMTQLDGEVLVEIPKTKNSKSTVKFLVDNSNFAYRVEAE